MPIKFAKGAFRVTSRTYLKRIPQGGFAPDKISYDFSVTIPQGQLQKLGKATKRGLKKYGGIALVGGSASYVGSRMAMKKRRRK